MALKYTVHQCPLELYTLVDLTCQATESTPSNKRGCPFPPPGWRQGPSNPGQRICCSPAVKMTWRSPPEDQNQDQTVYLVWRAGCWKAAIRSPRSLLFSSLNSPNSRLSSQERCSSPRIIFVASSGPIPTGPCLSCVEGSRAGHGTPGEVSPEWSRGAESLPLTCWLHCFWCSQGYCWLSGLQDNIIFI